MVRWEYTTVEFTPNFLGQFDLRKMMYELNAMGEVGWELVSTVPFLAGPNKILLFKRPGGDVTRTSRQEELK